MVFYGFCGASLLAVSFAVLMLFQGTLYAGALCLLGVLLQVAVIFFLSGAQLLGWIQALVYAGAVMVLVVVAITAAPPGGGGLWARLGMPRWLVALFVALPLAELAAFSGWAARAKGTFEPITPKLEKEMAALLFGAYAPMTEWIGLLVLLSAMAVVLRDEWR